LAEIDNIGPGHRDFPLLCQIRALITATFGLPTGSVGRELVRVGA
jgi:hypothetical protein